ncbi:MAG TPA: hypothetical protein VFY92_06735 [Hyphomicrobiaceae bacterium]|nr:hypothetical protein [Hyphomicrobiaceae bacterium]
MTDQASKLFAGPGGLTAMLACLKADNDTGRVLQADRSILLGETVLVVESESTIAEKLQTALERAGAEALVARTAVEALARMAQFDVSAAVVEWRPDAREHRALVHRLREGGVRYLYCAGERPETGASDAGVPVVLKSASAATFVAELARLTAVGPAEAGGVVTSADC